MNHLMIYQAFVKRDARALAESLRLLRGGDIYFDPLDTDTPNPNEAGSIVGLCASVQWHDGLRVCRDAGVNPDRNSMVRDPLIWAFCNDDIDSLQLLIEMGLNPARLSPDDRHWGLEGRPLRHLSDEDIAKCVGDDYGELDKIYLSAMQQSNANIDLRPVFGRMALNNARANSHYFYDSLTQYQGVQEDVACLYFAQFAYYDAYNRRRNDIMNILVNNLGLTPDKQLAKGRMLLQD